MAVFTHVAKDALERFLEDYDLGVLIAHEGIESGAENTNYRLKTDTGAYVLTLFERRTRASELPYFTALMTHLAHKGLPAPRPMRRRDGGAIGHLCGRPALIVTFLPGAPRMPPSTDDCRRMGDMLASMHDAGRDFPLARANDLSLAGWKTLAEKLRPLADVCADGLSRLIEEELGFLAGSWPTIAPAGAVHADLFPDNVFFGEDDAICGVIDFYFACTEMYVFDIAICLNAWATDDAAWSPEKAGALLDGYERRRRLSVVERSALPIMLRGAALRFLLTRLHDWLNRVEGAQVTVKSPLEYRDILMIHRDAPPDSLYTLAR